MKKFILFFTIAALCLGSGYCITAQFNTRNPSQSVYSGTFQSLDYQEGYCPILTDVTVFLHPIPEGFIEKPTQIWPAIKLTPKGIFAQTDIQLGERNYAAVTQGLHNFFTDPDQPILLKQMRWVQHIQTPFPRDRIKIDVYTVDGSKQINVIDGYFDITVPSDNVYHLTLEDAEKGAADQHFKGIRIHEATLYGVMIPLYRLPDGFIKKPTQIWPAIKLTPEGIFAHVNIEIRDISIQDNYEGATAYLIKLIRQANNKIILKNLFWKADRSTHFDTHFNQIRIYCDIYIIKDGKQISVGLHMIEAGYGIYPGC